MSSATGDPMRLALLILLLSAAGASAYADVPAPPLQWEPWQHVGVCFGARYEVAYSKYDGQNDFHIKFRVFNETSHVLTTRFRVQVVADSGQTVVREGRTRINPGALPVEGGPIAPAFNLGAPFETPVNQKRPTWLRAAPEFLYIDAADITRPLKDHAPSTYLDDYRDYPNERCLNRRGPAPSPPTEPRFIELTRSCYGALPQWPSTCDRAVDAIMEAADAAPPSAIACLQEWRKFQKCYEIYAFERTPDPRPQCDGLMPRCLPD